MKIPMAKKHKNDHINKNLEDAQKEFHAAVKKKEHTFNDVRSKNTSIPSTTADMSKSKEKISISNTVKHEDAIKSSGIENIESRREHSASYKIKDTSSHSYEPKSQKSQNTGYTNRNLSDVQRQHEEHISSSKIGGGGIENRREPTTSSITQIPSGHSYEPKSQEPQSSDYVNKNLADAQRQYKEDVQKRKHSFSDVKSTSSHQTSSLTDMPKQNERISTSHTVRHNEERIHTSKIGGGTENRREPPVSGTTQIPSGHSYEPKNQEPQSSGCINKNLADAQRQYKEDVQKREHSFSDVKSTSSHQTSSLTDVPKEKERISTSHTVKHSEERIHTSRTGGSGTGNKREPPTSGTTQTSSGSNQNSVVTEQKIGKHDIKEDPHINKNVEDAQREFQDTVHKKVQSILEETKKPHQAVPIVVPKNTLKQNGINEKTVVPKITGQSNNRTTIENTPPSERIGGNGGNKKKNPTHKGNEAFTGDTEYTIKNSKTTRKIVSQHGQAASKKLTINKEINKNVAEAQRAHYERIQEQKNPFHQRSEKNTKRSTKDEFKEDSDYHVLDTVSLGAKETSDTEKSKDKRTAGACALGIKKSNRENVNKEIDFKKFSSPGILGHRIAALERLFIKTGTRFLVDTATQGTDARRGFQSMQDTVGVAATLIADNVMTSISKGFNNHSVRMCAHYNSLLIEAGGEKMYGKYGINTTFHSKKDIRRFQKGLNALLKKQGLAPIKGSGKLLLVNIARYLHRNKAMLTPELKEMIKMLARSARAETLFVNHGRFHALK